jgi:hypothetical protein
MPRVRLLNGVDGQQADCGDTFAGKGRIDCGVRVHGVSLLEWHVSFH